MVIFTTSQTSILKLEELRALGVEVSVDDAQRVDLRSMALMLKKIGVDHLMVEGGGTINLELMRLGLVDELMIYVAPLIFGGANAPTLAAGPGLERNEAIPLKLVSAEAWEDGGILVKLYPGISWMSLAKGPVHQPLQELENPSQGLIKE